MYPSISDPPSDDGGDHDSFTELREESRQVGQPGELTGFCALENSLGSLDLLKPALLTANTLNWYSRPCNKKNMQRTLEYITKYNETNRHL